MSGSRVGFLMIEVTTARLNDVGTDAAERDKFTILVIMRSSSSRQDFSRNVGILSWRQLLEGDLAIIPFTLIVLLVSTFQGWEFFYYIILEPSDRCKAWIRSNLEFSEFFCKKKSLNIYGWMAKPLTEGWFDYIF